MVYKDFNDLYIAGLDFGEEIKELYPDLSTQNYDEFINNYYETQQAEMLEIQDQLNKQIKAKATQFFSALKNVFGKDYSTNNYTGYLSMFNCCPRFLSDNSFQIYYKDDIDRIFDTVYHELLHFIFFDFCKENVSETKNLDCDSGSLWELSEIFNPIILNTNEFQKILPSKHNLCYPDLEDKLKAIKKIWQEGLPISEFVIKSLDYLTP